MKRVLIPLLLMCVALMTSCSKKPAVITTGAVATQHDTKFGGIYVCKSVEELDKLGIRLGDAIDVELSTGDKFENIPYYDGYYCNVGEVLLCAYPGYPYPSLCMNFGDRLYESYGLDKDSTAVITLRERGAYLPIQNAMSMVYSNAREDFDSDSEFANFRALRGGALKEGLLYRGASPCNDCYSRASCVSALCEENGVTYFIDLADSEAELEEFYSSETNCPYWRSLYDSGNVLTLDLAANYKDEAFIQKIAQTCRVLTQVQGPFYIHCTEGKDRTGFVCILLEALAGASTEEITEDYMASYANYFDLTPESDSEKYEAVRALRLDSQLIYLGGTDDAASLTPEQLTAGARDYLARGGMTEAEIDALVAAITK